MIWKCYVVPEKMLPPQRIKQEAGEKRQKIEERGEEKRRDSDFEERDVVETNKPECKSNKIKSKEIQKSIACCQTCFCFWSLVSSFHSSSPSFEVSSVRRKQFHALPMCNRKVCRPTIYAVRKSQSPKKSCIGITPAPQIANGQPV